MCNGIDDDCDGTIDEPSAEDAVAWFPDTDRDGAGESGARVMACEAPPGTAPYGGDCDDFDPRRHPDAEETCNGVDGDCDGIVDNGYEGD